ncbi:IucA/IucC family siderophore biosynthesis protein [Streptomyces sp. JJ36]|uniref:IucA/IucC family protein n=1 Tax=Streptomyces sp. JJ36 TaxID=2736645 RepID=UPI001F310C53|nr:IucA/IucC family protein [Streptomyces sp. JJ36]MCF6523931.1 iron transporter [Streptomyces sp. JJ36]
MNARSGPQENPADGRSPVRKRLARLIDPAVPRQPRRTSPEPAGAGVGTCPPPAAEPGDGARHPLRGTADHTALTEPLDPLEDPDPAAAADAAAVENLLRCWVRENDLPRPDDDELRLPLHSAGTELRVPVRHWSATGWHRLGRPLLDGAPPDAVPLDAVTLAALLGREAAYCGGAGPAGESTELVGRVADSVRRTADFLADRRADPGPPPGTGLFLAGEQSLLLGHPLHPTPKSREGLSDAEARTYSPELRGSFPLHWMAVDPAVLATDSAWHEHGPEAADKDGGPPDPAGGAGHTVDRHESPVPAARLAARLLGDDAAGRVPEGFAPLPLHPWQARELRHRPEVAELLAAGLLRDLGPLGEAWHPTSSVRTVHRPGAPAMVKLSLGLRITNSRRENLRKELLRGVEVHRILRAGLGAEWRAAHPAFDIVRDPAWLGVNTPGGEPVPGLDTVFRQNPFAPRDEALCVAALTSPRPWPGGGEALRSRLAEVVEGLARQTGRPVAAVAAEWFLRYLESVVRPVLWLDARAGIALEAHQQNTLVLLDSDGWPRGGRYRDNQGYYFRVSHRQALEDRLPGAGVASDSFVADEVTDERFAYYLGINNVLGLVGAFGSQGLADERLLLAAFRGFLDGEACPPPGTPASPLPALLLRAPVLRCKANLLTRLHGMDELVGPVDTQSVYVSVRNPLAS